MNYGELVQIVERLKTLADNLSDPLLWKLFFLRIKLTSLKMLRDQVDVLVIQINLIQLHDVRMVHRKQNTKLFLQFILLSDDRFSFDRFYRKKFARVHSLVSDSHRAERATAQIFCEGVS